MWTLLLMNLLDSLFRSELPFLAALKDSPKWKRSLGLREV